MTGAAPIGGPPGTGRKQKQAMQVILHKTPLVPPAKAPATFGLVLGDSVHLRADSAGEVTATIARRGLWLPLIGRRERQVSIGHLCPEAARIVAPALQQGADFRVRIVEICPAHLSADGHDNVCLSVWGDRDRLARAHAKRAEPDNRPEVSAGNDRYDHG